MSVTSPAGFDYAVFDLNGKVMNKGKLENGMNTITISSMIRGMYLIRYTNSDQQWTEKLVKQ